MNIDKAIERLQEDIDSIGNDEVDTLTEAEKLGIEALKKIRVERQYAIHHFERLLPGETRE